MKQLSAYALEQEAHSRLEQASYDPRKLALIHAALAVGVTFLLTVINYILTRQIGNTGGLSGISTRTTLESIRYILQLAATLALPFWEAGFLYCAMCYSRSKATQPKDLAAGFQKFRPLLRFWILQGLLLFCFAFVAIQVSSIVIMMTPWGEPIAQVSAQISADPAALEAGILPAGMDVAQVLEALVPVYILSGILLLVFAIPFFYRLRLVPYLIFDEQETRARAAMRRSRAMMKGNCMGFFKLDLYFWWFYLLQVLAALVSNLDVLLPMMGVEHSLNPDVAYFLFYGLYLAVTLLIAWAFRWRIETVYACAYNQILGQEEPDNALPSGTN